MAHDSFTIEAMIRGYHVYSDIWNAVIDEELPCAKESGNLADPFAVGVMKDGTIVGHVPRKISSVCSLFLQRSGSIVCRVIVPQFFCEMSDSSFVAVQQGILGDGCLGLWVVSGENLTYAPLGFAEESAQFFTAVLASLIAAGETVEERGPYGLGPSLTGFRCWYRAIADSIASYTCTWKNFHRFLFSHTLTVFGTCENLYHSKIFLYTVVIELNHPLCFQWLHNAQS